MHQDQESVPLSKECYQGRCPIPGCNKVFKNRHWGIDAHINGRKHLGEFSGETYEERYAAFKTQYPQPWPLA